MSTSKATRPAERICTDISGPYKKSIVRSNYWILVVDKFSGKSWSFFVKKKSQMAETVSTLLAKLNAAEFSIKYQCCDNAGGNTKGLTEVCDKLNVQIEFTAPYTPHQNGIVECKFVTIRDRNSAAMIKARFSEESQGLLWAESASTHVRLPNIVCNSGDMAMCPDWKFYGKKPTIYAHLIEFGRIAWVKLGKKPAKLDIKATKCIMIGYSADHAGDTYRMYNPSTKKVINSRNIRWADWHGIVSPTMDMKNFTTKDLEINYEEVYKVKQLMIPVLGNAQQVMTTPKTILQQVDMEQPIQKAVRLVVSEAEEKEITSGMKIDATKTTKLQHELWQLDGWTMVNNSKAARRSLKLGSTTKNPTHDTVEPNVEIHVVYSMLLASDHGEPKWYKQSMNGAE
jgi:hypothetical protein